MPVFTGAVPQLMRSYVNRERSSFQYINSGGIYLTTPLYRDQLIVVYKVPYYGAPPEEQVADTPAGMLFQGYENTLRSIIPAIGDHIDTFAGTLGGWKTGDGEDYVEEE